ncbi:MAG: hypothetical protein GXO47_01040 [Chlorobi bacterium]|nr:hypothetical protein [Chlorobiota bacterium]
MNTFFKIRMVARYESKTLLRSWFFRIFSALALIIIIFFDLFGFGVIGGTGLPGRLIPGAVPYLNLFFLNIAQAVIAIFLSADFLGRDKKLDTTEAFYIRDISNFAYVTGKTLGILKVFVILNLIVLLIGAVITFISNDLNFNLYTFVIYPLLVSLPTLVFVLGLSFFVMMMVRNQAITFVLLLGYIAVSLFYFQYKLYGVWDFLNYFTPMAYSDFTGFSEFYTVLLLRGAYFIAGLFFVGLTIALLPRLPQEKKFRVTTYLLNAILLATAISMFGLYIVKKGSGADRLNEVRKINAELKDSPYSVESYDINLVHEGSKIITTVVMSVADTSDINDHLVFALNPGLKVESVKVNGKNVDYTRNLHLITIPETALEGNFPVDIEMKYSGNIDNSVMYPDISDETRSRANRANMSVLGKDFAYVTPGYVLLTREANWYPVVATDKYWTKFRFSDFMVQVKTKPELTVIAQGEEESPEPGVFVFDPKNKLNAFSLTIGNYISDEMEIDSVRMRVFRHPKHNAYLLAFDSIRDTIPYLIKEMKNDYERKLGIKYPFDKFYVVEAPVHYLAYMRSFTLATENQMPEIVYFPENGGGNWRNDLNIQSKMIESMSKRTEEELSKEELQVKLFKRFIGENFFQPTSFFMGIRIDESRKVDGWGPYQVFPMFYTYRDFIDQKGYPVLNIAMESYLFSRQKTMTRGFSSGLNSTDKVILSLKDKSLNELIKEKQEEEFANIIAAKGTQLFNTLRVQTGDKDFDGFIDSLLAANAFTNYSLKAFSDDISAKTGNDFRQTLNTWMNENKTAAFLFGRADVYKITDGDRVRHFISLPVKNTGEADGIIEFMVMEGMRGNMRGRFRSRMSDAEDNKKSYLIKAGETVEIGFITEQEPRVIFVNTFLAKNIPSSSRIFDFNVIEKEGYKDYFEGIRPSKKEVRYAEPFEIIVDNEDKGCEVINTAETNSIKDWWVNRQNALEEDMEYKSFRFWNPPYKWELVAGANFFGKYIKSAYFKRSGNGDARIKWSADIKESGDYDVYAYLPRTMGRGRFRNKKKKEDKYLFIVHHDDGDEDIEVTIPENGGWELLGDFYFSEGKAVIELSDKTDASMVIGDAIKLVKR